MKHVTAIQLKPFLWCLNQEGESSGFLVIGDEKACLIDTMTGFSDLSEVISSITDKEIIVVNTHAHPDHIFGNMFFDHAYLNSKDLPLAEMFTSDKEFIAECDKIGHKMPPFRPISQGDIIELGGKTLSVYELSGHTEGGILLLLEQDRILFTGDSINHHLWMQLPQALSVGKFREELEKVLFLEQKADFILHSHATDFDDISLMRSVYNGVCDIIAGKTEADSAYNWFGGEALQHPFEIDYKTRYNQIEHVICYDKNNI